MVHTVATVVHVWKALLGQQSANFLVIGPTVHQPAISRLLLLGADRGHRLKTGILMFMAERSYRTLFGKRAFGLAVLLLSPCLPHAENVYRGQSTSTSARQPTGYRHSHVHG